MQDTSKGRDRGANVYMAFSGTEIVVTAEDKDDQKTLCQLPQISSDNENTILFGFPYHRLNVAYTSDIKFA